MTEYPVNTRVLDEEGCQGIFGAALRVLEKTGVEVEGDDALESLRGAGAYIDGKRVRMPRGVVQDALSSVPDRTRLRSRGPRPPLSLADGPTYYGGGSDTAFILGPEARARRLATLADVEGMAALQEKLVGYDFVMSMAWPSDVAPATANPAQFAAMLRGTSKPIIMVTSEIHSMPILSAMAAAAGAEDSWCLYAQPTSPLVHGHDSVQRLVACARANVPVIYPTTVLQGATAPASRAGMMVVAAAETLSALVIHQLAHPGAPFVYGVTQGSMNMRSGAARYVSPEAFANQLASGDMARFFGLPSFGNGGHSDSQLLDEQWAAEAAVGLLVAGLSRITLVHDVGYLASGMGSSYESCVVMDELIDFVRATLGGIVVDAESLAEDEIMDVGPGGNYLSRPYTRQHRRDFPVSILLNQVSHDAWERAGSESLLERASRSTQEIRSQERAYVPGAEIVAALDELLADAGRLAADR